MKQHTQIKNQITEGVIWKQLLIFFFPIVFGTLFQQLYNTVDTLVLGRYVGKEALASVGGSSAQIVILIVGFFTGLSSGASVVIAQFFGAQDERRVQQSLHTAYAFSVIGSVVIGLLGILMAPSLLRWMNTPPESCVPSGIQSIHFTISSSAALSTSFWTFYLLSSSIWASQAPRWPPCSHRPSVLCLSHTG